MAETTPLQQHKGDLEAIIYVARQLPLAENLGRPVIAFGERVARLAEALLVNVPEESHCPNHPADQICPECTS